MVNNIWNDSVFAINSSISIMKSCYVTVNIYAYQKEHLNRFSAQVIRCDVFSKAESIFFNIKC